MRLSRSLEDICDSCVRIDTLLFDDSLDPQTRESLLKEKEMHLDAARGQRKMMSDFVEKFVKNIDPYQILPDSIIPEDLQENSAKAKDGLIDESTSVLIQADDFGGSLALPHYGFNRPSSDYFNSKLILHNFVIANISKGVNYVTFYDERGQDKGADCLCNLRLRYHINQIPTKASVSISILDNCVGQNKSNVTMIFNAFLSLVFYERVVLLYLIPGQSHMIADRVVAWNRGEI